MVGSAVLITVLPASVSALFASCLLKYAMQTAPMHTTRNIIPQTIKAVFHPNHLTISKNNDDFALTTGRAIRIKKISLIGESLIFLLRIKSMAIVMLL